MRTRLIQIGDSQGIRLPKKLIKQYDFQEEVQLVAQKAGILILPLQHKVRDGWEEAIANQIDIDHSWLNLRNQADSDWTW